MFGIVYVYLCNNVYLKQMKSSLFIAQIEFLNMKKSI